MTSKLTWVAAAAIIVVAAVGAWALLGTPVTPTETGEWTELLVPGQVYGYPAGSLSGINAIHFMAHGSGYLLTDNLATYTQANDNRIGSITSSGATIATFPFDVAFDIVVDVTANKDNIGQLNVGYLMVSLGLYSDSGIIHLVTENSLNTAETIYSSPANYIHVNAKWDNTGNTGYKLTADDNLYLENVSLWLRG